ncbi:MAG: DUF1641 domain-containing protein [Firmicutes bacterium]|nr:DUF1641 domain-containing protein [Bacillota bacterium]
MMAAPIRTTSSDSETSTHRPADDGNRTETATLLADHGDAVKDLLALVQQLHAAGFLEAARAMVEARTQIAQTAIEQASRPEVIQLLQNLLAVGGAFTSVDPEAMSDVARSLAAGMEAARNDRRDKAVTVFELARALSDPDINRGIRFALTFLQGLGKGLRN